MNGLYPEDFSPDFTLPVFASLPPDKQPTFRARFLTARKQREFKQSLDASVEAERINPDDVLENALPHLYKTLAIILARYQIPGEAPVIVNSEEDTAKLEDYIGYDDLWSVVTESQAAIRLKRDELKKYGSLSALPTEHIATPAQSEADSDSANTNSKTQTETEATKSTPASPATTKPDSPKTAKTATAKGSTSSKDARSVEPILSGK